MVEWNSRYLVIFFRLYVNKSLADKIGLEVDSNILVTLFGNRVLWLCAAAGLKRFRQKSEKSKTHSLDPSNILKISKKNFSNVPPK